MLVTSEPLLSKIITGNNDCTCFTMSEGIKQDDADFAGMLC